MKSDSINLIRKWLTGLAQATQAFELHRLDLARRNENGHAPDCIATLRPAKSHKKITLLIETRCRLSPREAVAVCHEVRSRRQPLAGVVIACPYVSPRVAEICRQYGIGYLDQAGNCDIRFDGLVVHVEGRPNPVPDTRPLQSPFSLKASRVARQLLSHPNREWQVGELAKESHISAGLASKAKNALIEQGYAIERDGRVVLHDPHALLEAWTAAYQSPVSETQLYVMEDLPKAEAAVARWCEAQKVVYALAGFSGAWRLAPMVRYTQGSIHVQNTSTGDLLGDIMKAVRAKPVPSGSNLVISLTSDESVFFDRRRVNDFWVASPVQLYLELRRHKARGEEAAAELLRQLIEPTFATSAGESSSRKVRGHG